MDDLTGALRAHARACGADLIGIAHIDRFEGVLPQHDPRFIFPEARSVVVIGRRITRGTLRGLEEGTQFLNYTLYGYDWLDNRFVATTTFQTAEFLEDHGWEAVPLMPLPPEIPPMGISVKADLPPPNVLVDLEDAAVRAGLGEIGYARIFLSPQYGPRQRFQAILTDAVLAPDPIYEGQICDRDPQAHEAFCPLGAIDPAGQEVLEICGKEMLIAKVDYAVCGSCENGAKSNLYHPSGKPDRLGAICVRSCLARLEEAGRLGNTFHTSFRKRRPWAVVRGRVFADDPLRR
jgi:epoxyqueuosine reductase QueG